MVEAEVESPTIHAGSLRRALLRGFLAGLVAGLGAMAYFSSTGGQPLKGLLLGFFGGLVVVPVTFVEFWAERFEPTRARSIQVAVSVWTLATLGTFCSYLQALFTLGILTTGDRTVAYYRVERVLHDAAEEPLMFFAMLGAIGVVFASIAFSRGQRISIWGQLLIAGAAVVLLSYPLLFAFDLVDPPTARFVSFMTWVAAMTFPFIYLLGDTIEPRLWGEADQESPQGRSG